MEASEMMDVLHYFFEDDYIVASTAEQARNVTEFRKRLYGSLYGTSYSYGANDGSSNSYNYSDSDTFDDSEDFNVTPFDVKSATKPYIPPTEPMGGMTPFGDILDSPVG